MSKKQIIAIVLFGIFLPFMAESAGKYIRIYSDLECIEWKGVKIQYLKSYFTVEDSGIFIEVLSKYGPNHLIIKKANNPIGIEEIDLLVKLKHDNGCTVSVKNNLQFKDEDAIKLIITKRTFYDEIYFIPNKGIVIWYSGLRPPSKLFKMLIDKIQI